MSTLNFLQSLVTDGIQRNFLLFYPCGFCDCSESITTFLNIEHKITSGFFVENTVIVAEGELLSNGIFQVCSSHFIGNFEPFSLLFIMLIAAMFKSCTGQYMWISSPRGQGSITFIAHGS